MLWKTYLGGVHIGMQAALLSAQRPAQAATEGAIERDASAPMRRCTELGEDAALLPGKPRTIASASAVGTLRRGAGFVARRPIHSPPLASSGRISRVRMSRKA